MHPAKSLESQNQQPVAPIKCVISTESLAFCLISADPLRRVAAKSLRPLPVLSQNGKIRPETAPTGVTNTTTTPEREEWWQNSAKIRNWPLLRQFLNKRSGSIKCPGSIKTQAGWIEFGRPQDHPMSKAEPQLRSYQPHEGMVVLFPSYFYHRTEPFESQDQRISIAFDIVPLS